MRAGRPLTQNSVGVLRNVFDLHARHGAIMAPTAPKRKRGLIKTVASSGPYLTPNPMRHKKSGICQSARLAATTEGPLGAASEIVALRRTQSVSPLPDTPEADGTKRATSSHTEVRVTHRRNHFGWPAHLNLRRGLAPKQIQQQFTRRTAEPRHR